MKKISKYKVHYTFRKGSIALQIQVKFYILERADWSVDPLGYVRIGDKLCTLVRSSSIAGYVDLLL